MRHAFLIISLVLSQYIFAQTPIAGFECHMHPGFQGFTQNQIDTFISKGNYEGYRLLDRRTTLSFDNGFEIILLSANEMLHSGLIGNTSAYPAAFPDKYTLPVFHLAAGGWVSAGYTADHTKSKGR
jgi:hypothetical protein